MLTTLIILDALIAVQTVIVIALAIVLLVVLKRAMKATDALRHSVLELLPKVNGTLEKVDEMVKASQPVGGRAAEISADVQKIVESTRGTVDNVADVVNEVSSRIKIQAERVDAVLTDSLQKIEQLSDTVTENLMMPMAELSAVIRGGYAAAKYLRRPKTPTVAPGDGHEEEAHM